MKFGVTAVALLAVAATLFAMAVVVLLGPDLEMLLGALGGFAVAAGLSLLGARGVGRALKNTRRRPLLMQLYGGFLLRMVLLIAGFGALAASGVANPVGFAVAFLTGTVLLLFRRVRNLERVATTSGA